MMPITLTGTAAVTGTEANADPPPLANRLAFAQSAEIANIAVSFLGLFLSMIGVAVLMAFSTLTRQWEPIVASAVYGTTLVLLFLASMLYHIALATDYLHKKAFEVIDHCAI